MAKNVVKIEDFLINKIEAEIDNFNAIAARAAETLNESDFADFSEHMIAEIESITKKIRDMNNERT